MKDRFYLRAWDKFNKKYIYDVQFDPDFRHIVHSKQYEIEQYTGVNDRMGNRIYENDILAKSKDAQPWDCYTVFWQGSSPCGIELQFQVVCYDNGFSYVSPLGKLLEDRNKYQIIGNIHENEELKEMLDYGR